MTITKDQLLVGTWAEVHDCYGGIYHGRVVLPRSFGCRVLIERIISQPTDRRWLNPLNWSISGEDLNGLYVPEDEQPAIYASANYSHHLRHPWIKKILDEPTKVPRDKSNISAQGKFLSDAHRYTNGPDGEVAGCSSGFKFL